VNGTAIENSPADFTSALPVCLFKGYLMSWEKHSFEEKFYSFFFPGVTRRLESLSVYVFVCQLLPQNDRNYTLKKPTEHANLSIKNHLI
jgi:hypothetical protein